MDMPAPPQHRPTLSPERERQIDKVFEMLGLLADEKRDEVRRRLGTERDEPAEPLRRVPRWWHDSNLPSFGRTT